MIFFMNCKYYFTTILEMKIKLITAILFLFALTVPAQNSGKMVYVDAGVGEQSLLYGLQNGMQNGGSGGNINIGLVHFLNSNLGIQTGVGLSSYTSSAILNFSTSEEAVDADGDNYEFRTVYKDLKEEQNITFLNIPLGLVLKKPITYRFGLMSMAGAKVSFPLKAAYQVKSGQIVTTGFYKQWNMELSDLPQHGFSTFQEKYSGDLTIHPSFSLYADFGFYYRVNFVTDFYFGGCVNYGLNSITKSEDKAVFQKDGIYNGVFSSSQITRVIPVFVGIKAGFYMQWGKKGAADK